MEIEKVRSFKRNWASELAMQGYYTQFSDNRVPYIEIGKQFDSLSGVKMRPHYLRPFRTMNSLIAKIAFQEDDLDPEDTRLIVGRPNSHIMMLNMEMDGDAILHFHYGNMDWTKNNLKEVSKHRSARKLFEMIYDKFNGGHGDGR